MPGRYENQRHERPQLEIRIGGLSLTVQRVPGWLVASLATATGSVLAAWFTAR